MTMMIDITWGDTVRICDGAKPEERPGALAAVCGIREVDSAELATELNCSVGDMVYLIEFGDGFSIEITANQIVLFDEQEDS